MLVIVYMGALMPGRLTCGSLISVAVFHHQRVVCNAVCLNRGVSKPLARLTLLQGCTCGPHHLELGSSSANVTHLHTAHNLKPHFPFCLTSLSFCEQQQYMAKDSVFGNTFLGLPQMDEILMGEEILH